MQVCSAQPDPQSCHESLPASQEGEGEGRGEGGGETSGLEQGGLQTGLHSHAVSEGGSGVSGMKQKARGYESLVYSHSSVK